MPQEEYRFGSTYGCLPVSYGFYIDTRYPVHWPTEYTREDAQEAMKAATEIRSTVKDLLKSFIER